MLNIKLYSYSLYVYFCGCWLLVIFILFRWLPVVHFLLILLFTLWLREVHLLFIVNSMWKPDAHLLLIVRVLNGYSAVTYCTGSCQIFIFHLSCWWLPVVIVLVVVRYSYYTYPTGSFQMLIFYLLYRWLPDALSAEQLQRFLHDSQRIRGQHLQIHNQCSACYRDLRRSSFCYLHYFW